jgi:pimeloyl-ACP methyl ester carboxylesterase
MSRLGRSVASCGLVSVLAAPQAVAQIGAYVTDPEPVNVGAATDHSGPEPVWDIAPDITTDGTRWVVAWFQVSDDPAFDRKLVASSSVDGGETWSPPTLIAEPTNRRPRLATDGAGVWGVVWQQSPGAIALFARSTDGGVTWSPPVPLDPAPTTQRSPSIATNGHDWMAVWEVDDEVIVVARSSDGGMSWSPPGQLSGNTPGGLEHNPAVSLSRNGTMVAAWECLLCPGENDRSIRYARAFVGECAAGPLNCRENSDCAEGDTCILSGAVECDSVPPGTPCCPAFSDGEYCWLLADWLDAGVAAESAQDFHPTLATDGSGVWLAAWWSDAELPLGDGVGSVLIARSFDDGASWTPPVPLVVQNGGASGRLGQPQVATDGRGNWIVVWDSVVDPWSNVSEEQDVYVSRSTDNGLSWTTPQALNTNFEDEDPLGFDVGPRIATDGTGRWIGVWESEDSFHGAYGNPPQEFNPDGDVFNARFTLSEIELVEPTSQMLEGPDISPNELVLLIPGEPRWGLAADGETRLLVRLPVAGPGNVQFGLSDEQGLTLGVGSLSTPGGSEDTTSLPVGVSEPVPGRYLAFAVLRAPEDFARDAADHDLTQRTIRLTAQYFPQGGGQSTVYERDVVLVRPPVMLLHGVWGTLGTWGNADQQWSIRSDPRFTVRLGDYETTNAKPFRENVPEVRDNTAGALNRLRNVGIAATQADVVGHSMGGLLTRLLAANVNGDYIRDDNYAAGDINRLITLDTPHAGSPLANLLLELVELPVVGPLLQSRIETTLGKVHDGAVHDLRVDSPEIVNLPAASLPVHAIIGIGGSDLEQPIDLGLREHRLYRILSIFGYDLPSVFLPESLHDLVVGRNSQLGGLPALSDTTSAFGYADPVDRGLHLTVTKEQRIGDRVVDLLHEPVGADAYASGFPAGSGQPASPPQRISRGARGVAPGALAITEPAPGTVLTAGQPFTVTVSALAGYLPREVLLLLPFGGASFTEPPFTATFTVPVEHLGPVTIDAIAVDESDVYAFADTLELQSVTTATLQAISIANAPLFLSSSSPTGTLSVVGLFDDGVERDVSGSAFGTTYQSQRPEIATVDAEGVVTAQGTGTVFIDVANAGWAIHTVVIVASLPLRLELAGSELRWPASSGAIGYDVVRGNLGPLLASGGDFAASGAQCLADNLVPTTLEDPDLPASGAGFWYLLRVVYSSAGGTGSYDVAGTGNTRDAGLAAAPGSCP